jgi:phosphopantothenoylcysteine decarboxylase/phosphopantothenate--cysteine ligase
MNILVTAGPTHEYWDAVRYLGNASSGRMGMAVADAAARRGHRVTLVLGPTALPPPRGVRVVRVVSARQMRAAVGRVFPAADAVVMAAAVADYRPAGRIRGKLRRSPGRTRIDLLPNPDILAGLGRRKGRRILVGYALQAGPGRREALDKLRRKNLDWCVLDHPGAIGADRATVTLIDPAGGARTWRDLPKRRFGGMLCRLLESRHADLRRSRQARPHDPAVLPL